MKWPFALKSTVNSLRDHVDLLRGNLKNLHELIKESRKANKDLLLENTCLHSTISNKTETITVLKKLLSDANTNLAATNKHLSTLQKKYNPDSQTPVAKPIKKKVKKTKLTAKT